MIEAFFALAPERIAINKAHRCACKEVADQRRPAKRGRRTMRTIPYRRPDEDYKKACVELRRLVERAWSDLTWPVYREGPVVVEYTHKPRRVHRQGPAKGEALLDVDAPGKALLDALKGVAYADDAQIRKAPPTKTTAGPVGIRVRVYRPEEMNDDDGE